MNPTPRSSRPAEWMLASVVAILALLVYGWVAAEGMGTIGFSDSADYLFFADYYRGVFAGRAQTLEAIEFYRSTRFPPLFPLVLAALGGGTEALERAQLICCASALGMLVVLWVWMRTETRSAVATATITALVALSPGLFLLVLNPVSEPMAMAMTWVVFMLASRSDRPTRLILLMGLVAGLSTLARSINIALVVAIPVWLLLQRAPARQLLGGTFCALLPFLAWLGYRRSIPEAQSYLDGLDSAYLISELGGWPDMLYLQPWTLLRGLAKNLDHDPGPLALSIATLILVLAAIGWWKRARARELDAVFLVLYVGVILVWPFPREAPRFMTFVLPLLYFYAWLGIRTCLWRRDADRDTRLVAAGALTVVVFAGSIATIAHFVDLATQQLEPELRREMRTQLYFHAADRATGARAAEGNTRVRFAAREVLRQVPKDDCVYASLPYVIQVHGPIRVLRYPWSFVEGISVKDQLPFCNYFFVAGIDGVVPGHGPFYPSEQLKDWTSPVLVAEIGDDQIVAALLVRSDATEQEARPPDREKQDSPQL
jgi:hypothetical protein